MAGPLVCGGNTDYTKKGLENQKICSVFAIRRSKEIDELRT
jgi:hypothetical protein